MFQIKHSFTAPVKCHLATGHSYFADNQAMLEMKPDEHPKSIAARLEQAMDEEGIANTELADACDVSPQAVGGWKKTGMISRDKIVPVARTIRRSIDWLLTGRGPETASIDADYEFIPRYDVRAAAGAGSENEYEEVDKHLAFRRDWLLEKGLRAKDLKIIAAAGDSMEPRISDGDILLVDTSDRFQIQDGKIYALNIGGMTRVKRLSIRYDGSLVIRSDNLASDPPHEEVVPKEEAEAVALNIIGRVVWAGGAL